MMLPSYDTLKTEMRGEHVLLVTLNRPEVLNADTTPMTAHIAVPMSMIDGPTRTGGRPCSPTTLMMPPKACISGSYPGRRESGPLAPNAPTLQ